MAEVSTFRFLWKMVNEIEDYDFGDRETGSIISRYASMLDDRITNSGHSRSVDSLALYSTEQLEEELRVRKLESK